MIFMRSLPLLKKTLCLNYYGKEGAEKIAGLWIGLGETIKEKFQDEPIESIEDYEKGELYNLEKSSQKFDFPLK